MLNWLFRRGIRGFRRDNGTISVSDMPLLTETINFVCALVL
jgi:hypothetical protein